MLLLECQGESRLKWKGWRVLQKVPQCLSHGWKVPVSAIHETDNKINLIQAVQPETETNHIITLVLTLRSLYCSQSIQGVVPWCIFLSYRGTWTNLLPQIDLLNPLSGLHLPTFLSWGQTCLHIHLNCSSSLEFGSWIVCTHNQRTVDIKPTVN